MRDIKDTGRKIAGQEHGSQAPPVVQVVGQIRPLAALFAKRVDPALTPGFANDQ